MLPLSAVGVLASSEYATLGPEAGPSEAAGTDRVHRESQGRGNMVPRERAPDTLGALSVSTVTEHGEPVGTRSAADFLRAALAALGRDGDVTAERLQEIEGFVRHALLALGDGGEPD
jgi:hypothetical protein